MVSLDVGACIENLPTHFSAVNSTTSPFLVRVSVCTLPVAYSCSSGRLGLSGPSLVCFLSLHRICGVQNPSCAKGGVPVLR